MKLGALFLALWLTTGCSRPPVAWSDPTPATAGATGTRLAVDTAGAIRWVSDSLPVDRLLAATRCPSSVRMASADDRVYAVWWTVRPDSSAVLNAAVSPDRGVTWGEPTVVDTADVSSRGCARPAPSIAATGADVHFAYSMKSAEGTGVFVAHAMEYGSMLHSPVTVAYGDRLVNVSVAAHENQVAVAYEDPSGSVGRVDLALSRTQGHAVEIHTPASRDVDAAFHPYVALAGGRVAVTWTSRAGVDMELQAPRVVRVGVIQP